MVSTTLDRLLRIQATEPTTSSETQEAAPPPASVRGSPSTGRGASPYSRQFRVAFEFLQRYTDNPPRTPEAWDIVCDDMVRCANEGGNDELLMGLLCVAHEQIERVYKAARRAERP